MSTRRLISITVVLALLFASACYVYQASHPPCCDSGAYAQMGRIYAASGIVDTGFSNIRTYGYPYFLSMLWRISDFSGAPFLVLAFVAQTFLYIGLSGALSRLLYNEVSYRAGVVAMVGLTANLLVYPSLSIVLSDGLSVVVQIGIVLVLVRLLVRAECMSLLMWISHGLVLGMLSGFAVVVRPGNIHFALFECVALVIVLRSVRLARGVKASLVILCVVAGFTVAVAPQVISNWQIFHHLGFLPVYDFQGKQLMWGQQYLKYGTRIVDGMGTGMPYISPWASTADGTIGWYLRHPRSGFITAVSHVFGALDFDFLFTYIYGAKVVYRPVLFLFSQSIVFWGCVGWWRMFAAWRAKRQSSNRDITNRARGFLISVSGAYVVSWLAVYALSAVENRFALPVLTMAMPLALWAIGEFWTRRDRYVGVLTGFAVYLACAGMMSAWLSSLRVIL